MFGWDEKKYKDELILQKKQTRFYKNEAAEYKRLYLKALERIRDEVAINRRREDALLNLVTEAKTQSVVPRRSKPQPSKKDLIENDVVEIEEFKNDEYVAHLARQLNADDPANSVDTYIADIRQNPGKYQNFVEN